MDMFLTDSAEVEQLNPFEVPMFPTLKPQYNPDNNLIVVTADYDEKYMERKPKFWKSRPGKLLGSGYKFKRRSTLSDMYVKYYDRRSSTTSPFNDAATTNDNSQKDNYDMRNTNEVLYTNDEESIKHDSLKKHKYAKKRKIKILYDDVENIILTTNAYDRKSGIKSVEWEPVAYEQLDYLPITKSSTVHSVKSISTPIFWETLHYDGVDDLAFVVTKNSDFRKNNNGVDNINTSAEENIKNQSNEIGYSIDLVNEKTSVKLETDDDDIEVFKYGSIERNETQEMNKPTKRTFELKPVTVQKYDSKEDMDLESLVLSTLNTTNTNNFNKQRELEKPRRTESTDFHGDFDIIELLNQTIYVNPEPQRNELSIDLQNNEVEQPITQSNEVLERTDLGDNTEKKLKSNKLDIKDIIVDLHSTDKPILLSSTIVDITNNEFRPFRTTYKTFFNGKFYTLNDTTLNKNASIILKNDSLITEKSDIFFRDLLVEDNHKHDVAVRRQSYTTNNIPTLTVNGPRFTEAVKVLKKYLPTPEEKSFVPYINLTNTNKKSYQTHTLEATPSTLLADVGQVSRLVYKYKQSLTTTATKHMATYAKSVPKQTLPVIDYDYLFSQPNDNTPVPEMLIRTTTEHFSVLNVNPEHDGKFEWNDYNNYDEVLSNDETEISKWQKVIPLQLPEKKNTNFFSFYNRLSSPGNYYYTPYPKPKRTTYANILTTQRFRDTNVRHKRIFHLKIRRNSTFPNLKSTNKKHNVLEGGDDITYINNWTDDHGTDYYEFSDRSVTAPSVLLPREIYLEHMLVNDPHKKEPQVRKRNIKSTLFDELFKTQNFTQLVTIIWHKNSSNKVYKNVFQRMKYKVEREKRECLPIDASFVNAKTFIIRTGSKNQSNCLKNIVPTDDHNVRTYEHKVMATTATSLTAVSNMEATESSPTKRKNQLVTVKNFTETVEFEKRFSRSKPLLPKLLLERNQPSSEHAKYKKKSLIKLGNIWRFMAKSNMSHIASKSDDDNILYISNQPKLLVAKVAAPEGNRINIVKHEPKTIVIRTTLDPMLAFIKKYTDKMAPKDNDTETVHLNKTEYVPIAKLSNSKTYRNRHWQNDITVPTTLLEFTQNPSNTFIKKKNTAAVTPYELAKELMFIKNDTEETPLLKQWTPFMYKNQQLNLKLPLETNMILLTNKIDANEYATENHKPTTQHMKKLIRTTEQPETISLKPANLFDPPLKYYLYSKKPGATMVTVKVANNNIKQKKVLSSVKQNLTKSLSTLTPPYLFVTDWVKTKTNMIKNIKEKHYLSFFSKFRKMPNYEKQNLSNTNKRKPKPGKLDNELLKSNEKSKIFSKENTGNIEFNLVKLHVPSSFTKKYIPITTHIGTKFNVPSNYSNINLLNTTSPIRGHSANIKQTLIKHTTETSKKLTTTFYSTITDNPTRKTSKNSYMFKKALVTIAPKPKHMPNHWIYRLFTKYPVVVPRLDKINYLPFTKSVNKGSKIFKHWKNDHPTWVLHFWNKHRENHQTLSVFPAKLKYRKLETTTKDTIVNFYFKKNINKNTYELRSTRPTIKVPALPEIKRVRVVPLRTANNETLLKTESKSTLKSYISTSKVHRRITKEPLIKTNDRLLLREEARAKQMDEYILLMMKKTTTVNSNEKSTEWPAFNEDNWPPSVMKSVIESNKREERDEFPNYQDLLENEEQEPEVTKKLTSKKIRRGLETHKTIIVNRTDANNNNKVADSAEQNEQRLLDDVKNLLQHYFLSPKPWKFVNLPERTTAATTLLRPSLLNSVNKPSTIRKHTWRLHAIKRNERNQSKPKFRLIGRPRRNIIRKLKTI